jgi:hypothetical protein
MRAVLLGGSGYQVYSLVVTRRTGPALSGHSDRHQYHPRSQWSSLAQKLGSFAAQEEMSMFEGVLVKACRHTL